MGKNQNKKTQNSNPNTSRNTKMVPKPITCKICSKTFTLAQNLRRHMRFIHGDKLTVGKFMKPCFICKKIFKNHYLKTHIQSVHRRTKIFTCSICSKDFSFKQNLSTHIREIHQDACEYPKIYTCNFCHKSFNKKYNLQVHLLVCDSVFADRARRCKICRLVMFKEDIFRHMQSVHQRQKTYKFKKKEDVNQRHLKRLERRQHIDDIEKINTVVKLEPLHSDEESLDSQIDFLEYMEGDFSIQETKPVKEEAYEVVKLGQQ